MKEKWKRKREIIPRLLNRKTIQNNFSQKTLYWQDIEAKTENQDIDFAAFVNMEKWRETKNIESKNCWKSQSGAAPLP